MKHIIIVLFCSIALFSCTKQEKPQVLEPNPAAEVTAVTGDVRTFTHGEWSPALAGRVLLATDSLDIPASAACELKDVGKNVVQLKGAAKDDVAKLLEQVAPAKPASPVKPATGTGKVLSAVKKLEAKQTVKAVTPTAVAGIRGAQGRRPMIADTTKKDTTSHK